MDEWIEVWVDRRNLHRVELNTRALGTELRDGEILLAVERFALTANNVTYATLGDKAGFWQLFPAPAPWVCVPVWGFADVVASRRDEIAVGERVFGLLPMASHAVLMPARITRRGFVDAAAHREAVFPIYNQYARLAASTSRECASDDWQALIRPLFFTSFVLDDQLADAAYFGADTVLLSSASSKTALGTAFLLRARGDVRVLGLTSARHAEFVAGTGCFDAVLGYDDLGALKAQGAVAYVDFSGDAALRRTVHDRFGTALVHSLTVGSTHWSARAEEGDALPGVAVQTFFGPAQIRKRRAEWGAEALHARYDAAEKRFITAASQWLRIVQRHGAAEVTHAWSALLEGQAGPDQASIGHLLLDAQVGAADEDAAMSFLRSRPSLAQ